MKHNHQEINLASTNTSWYQSITQTRKKGRSSIVYEALSPQQKTWSEARSLRTSDDQVGFAPQTEREFIMHIHMCHVKRFCFGVGDYILEHMASHKGCWELWSLVNCIFAILYGRQHRKSPLVWNYFFDSTIALNLHRLWLHCHLI